MTINPFEVKFKTFCEKLENPIYIKENSLIFISGDSGSGKSVFLSHVFKQKEFKTKTYYQHTNSYPPLNYKVKEVISLLSVPDGDYNKFINFISNYFDINKFLNKRIKELSGGERSFIGLISSLFSNKEIIMLDEPLNMISDERREKAADLIKEVSKYKTIFVISHFKEIFSNIADVIIKIDNGNIETTYLDKKTDTTTTNSSSFIRSKRKTKIWRYVKDDFPLVLVFFVIVLSLQFLTIFSSTGIENEKIRVKSSFDLIDETMGKVMVTNNPPPTSIPDEKTQYPDDGDDINGIKIINTYYGESIIAVKPIGNVLKNFGYYQNISFLSEEELKNGNYKSKMSDGFEMPIISKISDNYNGKRDNFEVNDVIITNNFIKNLSSYLCSYFNITPNINIDDNINKISDKLKKHDFQNNPIKLTYFDISKSLKNVSTADYNVINDDETILKTINIVGFDFDYKSSHYFLRPYSCYEKNSDPFSDYLEITASSFDKRCQIVNISYSSPEEVAGLLNKSLIAKKDFTHYYHVNNYEIEPVVILHSGFKYSSFIEYYKDDKDTSSLGFEYYYYTEDYSDLKTQEIQFMINNNIYINEAKNNGEVLDRKFNPKTDVFCPQGEYDLGSKIKIFNKEYIIYGTLNATIRLNSIYLDKSEFSNDCFINLPQNISDYNNGTILSFSYIYNNPKIANQKSIKIVSNFKAEYPFIKCQRAITDNEAQKIRDQYAQKMNQKNITRAISISTTIITSITLVSFSLLLIFVLKRNYNVNKFKKNISKRDLVAPIIISSLIIPLMAFTIFTKSIAYFLSVYELPRLVNSNSLDYELGTKISNISTWISLALAILSSIYLFLRNYNLKENKKHE